MSSEEQKPDNEFWIAEDLMEVVQAKVAKINKQAAKVGAKPIQLSILGSKIEKVKGKHGAIKYMHVKVDGEAPKFKGWKFVASVDNKDQVGMIKMVPSEDKLFGKVKGHVGDHYSRCEHCHVDRYRTKTYVCQNENGSMLQVGKSCLKDFLGGRDPKDIVNVFSWFKDLEDWLAAHDKNHEGGGGSGGLGTLYHKPEDMLAVAKEITDKLGYVSNKMVYDSGRGLSTSNHLAGAILRTYGMGEKEKYLSDDQKEVDRILKKGPDKKNVDYANDVLKWFHSIPEKEKQNNSFYNNIEVILKNVDGVTTKNLGYLIALLPTYAKANDLLKKKEQDKKTTKNEWVGSPGERLKGLKLKVERTHMVSSMFGPSQLVSLKDSEGRVFTWFNGGSKLEVGEEVTLDGRVKDHKIYNGINQTMLSHVKVK